MKTVSELLELVALAVQKNEQFNKNQDIWFIDFSGHVNQIRVRYYLVYDNDNNFDSCRGYLDNPDQIQELYYFIKNRL